MVLARSPFVQFGPGSWETDLDFDGLDDRMELALAEAFSPYLINAWHSAPGDGKFELGEPTVLFQVRPMLVGGPPHCGGVSAPCPFGGPYRAISIDYELLWDYDDGLQFTSIGCERLGMTSHCGDSQEIVRS